MIETTSLAMNPPIPAPDPVPLPAPTWLFYFLLLLTFFLHIIPMNWVLGGGFVTLWADWRGKRADERYTRLALALAQIIPYAIAAAITLGVAALLFVQVVYGQFFYSSSVLIAVPWMSVIGILILAYYGHYRNAFRAKAGKGLHVPTAWASALLILSIGFIYTNNMTLMIAPESWRETYDAQGFTLNWQESSLVPRYLHIFVGALAVSGVLVVLYGLFQLKRDESYARWVIRKGATIVLGATAVQFFVGMIFLMSLRPEWRMIFLGQSRFATGLLMVGLVFALLAMGGFLASALVRKPFLPALLGVGSLLVTLAMMVLMRDALRRHALAAYREPLPESPQWFVIVLFFLLFIGAIGTVIWMLRAVQRAGGVTDGA